MTAQKKKPNGHELKNMYNFAKNLIQQKIKKNLLTTSLCKILVYRQDYTQHSIKPLQLIA